MKKAMILGMIIAFLSFTSIGFANTWWNTNWQYRRNITIDNTGNSDTLNNYQIAINITYDSDMQSDFDDIRFVDDTTELNYWLQEKVDSEWAYFWVKIPSVPALDTKDIYIYYGNSSVSSKSNGDNTFLFFDDFLGNILNTTKWYMTAGSITVNNSIVTIDTGGTGDGSIRASYPLQPYYWFEIKSRMVHKYTSFTAVAIGERVTLSIDDRVYTYRYEADDQEKHFYIDGSKMYEAPFAFTHGNWYRLSLNRTGTNSITGCIDNADCNTQSSPLSGNVSLSTWQGRAQYDWIFVRNHSLPEPTYSIGSEESLPPIPPCNCTELTERISVLEEEVEDLQSRVETLEQGQGTFPPHNHTISEVIGLQSILDSIQNTIRLVICELLPKGLLQAAKFDTSYCQ